MTNVVVKTEYTAGVLVRNQLKREIERYCFTHEIKCEMKENKGWLDSQVLLTLTGKNEDISPLLAWLKKLD